MIRKSPKVKIKICGYSECKKEFVPQRPMQQVCSTLCAQKFNEEKEVKKRVKEMKSNITRLSVYEDIAKKIFQSWIRKRDEKEGCISCPNLMASQWDGSHYFKAEIYSGVIFNEMNVNKSCSYCNNQLAGNLIEYRKGLVKKYGEEKVNELEVLAVKTKQYKFTREELVDIAHKYKMKIKANDYS